LPGGGIITCRNGKHYNVTGKNIIIYTGVIIHQNNAPEKGDRYVKSEPRKEKEGRKNCGVRQK
jgi:hypothetical protein